MTPIKILQSAIRVLKKGHKTCATFDIGCGACQNELVINYLKGEVDVIKWVAKNKRK